MQYVMKTLALLTAVAMSGSPAVLAQEGGDAAVDAPKGFWVEEASLDLGTVAAGTDAVAVFTFHNDTGKEVRILKAKPS
jgi:hypothetical protein